ncbi:hypothetical protein LY474_13100 [Myxococcus stipitatus]|uniref:hypothetical protein n=1 Tax=Myxococcus stipitatus TaxID=83455 RepID=UPI001F26D848|nr:hypothetical protein [Myxococcus stipitatus]MCE9668755.1 hypothetical protein [Myxococcus stipitatus]
MKPPLHLPRRLLLQRLPLLASASALTACGEGLLRPPTRFVDDPYAVAREASTLNTLLALAYKAVDGYAQGLARLATLRDDPSRPPEERDLAGVVYAVESAFQRHHADHVALLTHAVRALDSTPVRPQDARYQAPGELRSSVANLLKLAANEERRASIGVNLVVEGLGVAEHRFIVAAIEGTLTQHHQVLEALVATLFQVAPAFDPARAFPQSYVSSTTDVGGGAGLQEQPDLAIDG